MSYGEWQVDSGRNAIDSGNWHAWRARWDGSQWDYDRKCMSRDDFNSPQELVNYLAAQTAKEAHLAALAYQMQTMHLNTNNPFAKSSRAGGSSSGGSNAKGKSKGKGKATARSQTPPAGGNYAGQSSLPQTQAQYAYQLGRLGAATAAPSSYQTRGAGVSTNSGIKLDGYKTISAHKRKDFFKFGRVFRTPITESVWNSEIRKDEIFTEILRMVIVRPHARHSVAVACHTYNGRASVGKRVQDHMIIYSGALVPAPLPEEDPAILNRKPVQVRHEPPDEHSLMKPTSRINLAKLYTISHTALVRNVGTIGRRSGFRVRNYCMDIQGLLPNGGMHKQLAVPEDELGAAAD